MQTIRIAGSQATAGYSRRVKNVTSSRHFRSSLLIIFSLCTALYLVACGLLAFQHRRAYRKEAEAELNRVTLKVQESLNAMTTNAVFMGYMKTTKTLMSSPAPTNAEIWNMVDELKLFFNHSSYESVQVFFLNSRRIYVSGVGMYSWDDYYNQALLQKMDAAIGIEWWDIDDYEGRPFYEQPQRQYVRYVRKCPINSISRDGYIAITQPLENLHRLAESSRKITDADLTLFFNGQLIYSSNPNLAVEYRYGQSGHMAVTSTNAIPVTGFYSIPERQVWAELYRQLPYALAIYGLLCLLVLTAAFAYSRFMLTAVDRIFSKLDSGQPVGTAGRQNEFQLLGSAVDQLNSHIRSIEAMVQKNLPLVQERIIHQILCNPVRPEDISDQYREYGIEFPYPYFAVAILSFPELRSLQNYANKEKLKLLIRTDAEQAYSGLGKVYGTYSENETFLFLINAPVYDELEPQIREASRLLFSAMEDSLTIMPLCSISICSPSAPMLYHAYIQARRNLIFTSADKEEFICFSNQSDYSPSMDDGILNTLTQCVIDRNTVELKNAIRLFQNAYLSACTDAVQEHRLFMICLCSVTTRLLEMGIDVPRSQIDACLKKLPATEEAPSAAETLHGFLLSLINAEQKVSDRSARYVYEAIAFIEQHYSRDLSVPEIAENSAVNPIYLNKLFKLSTGKTISEYLNMLRIQKSEALLRETDETVNAISAIVGYHDSRSYIRFFKKFNGITPNEFRKR
ncbi:AraC family transcriptional regulator [Ruminococcaceae bacterium OttesenSCG-928-L11]|nr:AraC family transcriptional regulator [Ruminococcaceae bacterium OttesenSCG-928-L11]